MNTLHLDKEGRVSSYQVEFLIIVDFKIIIVRHHDSYEVQLVQRYTEFCLIQLLP